MAYTNTCLGTVDVARGLWSEYCKIAASRSSGARPEMITLARDKAVDSPSHRWTAWSDWWIIQRAIEEAQTPRPPSRCQDCANLRSRADWFYCAGDGRTVPRCHLGSDDLKLADECPMYAPRRSKSQDQSHLAFPEW